MAARIGGMANSKPIQIFKPGWHTAMSGAAQEFSEADLAATAAAYDPARHEAPIVVGHPVSDGPAYGWVKALAFADGRLEADPDQVDPEFAEMVAAGRFKKISASFYPPESPRNPVPGVFYLRHVGFLGAQAPAVKGLRQPEFADGDDGLTIEIDFSEPSQKETTAVTPEEKAALEAENAQLKTQLADIRQAQIHSGNAAFAEGLVAAGQMVPAQTAVAVATLDFLASQEALVEFGEGDDRQPLIEGFKTFLSGLPKRIDFGETATTAKAGEAETAIEFAAPHGYTVDAETLSTHAKAKAWQAQNKTDYLTAVKAVSAH